MAAHTLFCDFASLNRKDAGDWVSNCSKLADEAFKNSSDQTRLLGNLLVLEQYSRVFRKMEKSLFLLLTNPYRCFGTI